tara:strand:- start:185 stop:331 length:147 start_codon:yes stop_codon:yes gene_type:complete
MTTEQAAQNLIATASEVPLKLEQNTVLRESIRVILELIEAEKSGDFVE